MTSLVGSLKKCSTAIFYGEWYVKICVKMGKTLSSKVPLTESCLPCSRLSRAGPFAWVSPDFGPAPVEKLFENLDEMKRIRPSTELVSSHKHCLAARWNQKLFWESGCQWEPFKCLCLLFQVQASFSSYLRGCICWVNSWGLTWAMTAFVARPRPNHRSAR